MKTNNLPIGVFDSGIGGLTVVKEIIKELPNESLIYLGDTARIPYGTRSKEVITRFALELANFLLARKVKCLVVACNTISANSLDEIKKISPVPVVDVISSTLEDAQGRGRIGVIGTTSTINNSRAYDGCVYRKACPLFVPLAEEGMDGEPATDLIARGYLADLSDKEVDILILGCTHFPMLLSSIVKTTGEKITLITSGPSTARRLYQILEEKDLLAGKAKSHYEFYFTDSPEKAAGIGQKFLGQKLPGKVRKINL